VSLEELNTLAIIANVIDENFGAREVGILYNLSMMTNVSELENDRHVKMNLAEFIDAFGRIAEKLTMNVREYDKIII